MIKPMDYVATPAAPAAIGPYSQAVKHHGLVYTSGQIPLDPATGNVVEGDFEVHVRRVFENLKAVLTEAGTDFSKVMKATVYLADMATFPILNTVYAEYFGTHKPARTTVGVAQLPKGATVEVDLVAHA
jgi:2-iminobutanoate/2-iminopropanoate deaminase